MIREEHIEERRNTPARAFHLTDEILDAFTVVIGNYDRDKNLEVTETSELSND